VQPAIVVKIEVAAQTIDDLPHIPIFVQVNLLILDRSPKPVKETDSIFNSL
jgi:hypothetical protein